MTAEGHQIYDPATGSTTLLLQVAAVSEKVGLPTDVPRSW